jgi:hypothetical protein
MLTAERERHSYCQIIFDKINMLRADIYIYIYTHTYIRAHTHTHAHTHTQFSLNCKKKN